MNVSRLLQSMRKKNLCSCWHENLKKDLGKSTSWMVLPEEALDCSQIFCRRKEHFFTAEEEGRAELVLQVKGHRRSCHNQKCFEEFLGLIVLKIVFSGSPYWDIWKLPLITCVSSCPTTKVLKPSRTTLDKFKFTYYSVTVLEVTPNASLRMNSAPNANSC